MVTVPFVDLQAEYGADQSELEAAALRVLRSGWYIMGQEVLQFEQAFAEYVGLPHAVGVASGTDALLLALRALQIGAGDEVITVSHTAVATAVAIELSGATPVLVDIDPVYYTIDPEKLHGAIGSHTKAIIPVHLYGCPAPLKEILQIAHEYGLFVIEDCAQAHGAWYQGKMVGSWGDVAAYSFYPTKNLGALGDGGMVVTGDGAIAQRLRLLRQYGWRERYVSETGGYNSRLDEVQAALLGVKLPKLSAGNYVRRTLAQSYCQQLAHLPITLPSEPPNGESVYHLFVIQTEKRDALQRFLREQGIQTAIHYPVPIHLQLAYHRLGYPMGSLPVTESVGKRILSLPIYPQMPASHITAIAQAMGSFFATAMA